MYQHFLSLLYLFYLYISIINDNFTTYFEKVFNINKLISSRSYLLNSTKFFYRCIF